MIKSHLDEYRTIHSITYGSGVAKYERNYIIDSRWPEAEKLMVHKIEAAKARKHSRL